MRLYPITIVLKNVSLPHSRVSSLSYSFSVIQLLPAMSQFCLCPFLLFLSDTSSGDSHFCLALPTDRLWKHSVFSDGSGTDQLSIIIIMIATSSSGGSLTYDLPFQGPFFPKQFAKASAFKHLPRLLGRLLPPPPGIYSVISRPVLKSTEHFLNEMHHQ